MKEYTELENGYILLIEGEIQYTIPNDPANSDYQAYLDRDKPKVEHLTEIPTPDEA